MAKGYSQRRPVRHPDLQVRHPSASCPPASPVRDLERDKLGSSADHFSETNSKPPGYVVGSERLFSRWSLIEVYLAGLTLTDEPRLKNLTAVMRRSLLAGDRLRGMLCLETAADFGLGPEQALPSAVALELIHALSRVHDDLPALKGGSAHRYEEPNSPERDGEATKILAGDGFFGEALALITRRQQGSPRQLHQIVRELALATGVNGMVGGQMLALDATSDIEVFATAYDLRYGALFGTSAKVGAILADATPEEQQAVSDFAWHVGRCHDLINVLPGDIASPGSHDERSSIAVRHREIPPSRYTGRSGLRRLAEQAFDDSLEALERVPRDTAGMAELARRVYRGPGDRQRVDAARTMAARRD